MHSTPSNNAAIGLLLSGGLDSGILLGYLLQSGRRVQPFYVRSGLVWEDAEQGAVRTLLKTHASPALDPLVALDMPLGDLYAGHWSLSGRDVPEADTADDAVYLPGRNALLTLKPALWCVMHGIEELGLAVLGSNPFSDATEDFFAAYSHAIAQAAGRPFRIVRPFGRWTKREVMDLGRNMPLGATFSCIAPRNGLHCGHCNKCAERQNAFRSVEMADPTEYAGRGIGD